MIGARRHAPAKTRGVPIMLSLNTNPLSLNAQRRLNASQATLARTLERLSSGLRVNSARDDAAGAAVALRMTAEIRTSTQLQRGISDGVSLVQVGEGGLSAVHGILQRLRELAIQSANPTWSDQERGAIDAECVKLRDEIDHIADGTQIFGTFPLKGETVTPPPQLGDIPHLNTRFPTSGSGGTFSSGVVPLTYIPAGSRNVTIDINSLGQDDDLQLFTRDGRHLAGTPVLGGDADYTWTHNSQGLAITDESTAKLAVLTEENGFLPTAAYDAGSLLQGPASYVYPAGASASLGGMTITYSGDGDRYEPGITFNNGTNNDATKFREAVNIDEVTENLLVMVVGSGQFAATATWDYIPPAGVETPITVVDTTRILMAAPAGSSPVYHDIENMPADTRTLGVHDLDLSTAAGATSAIGALDQAIGTVSGYRARYGAHANHFENAISNLSVVHENISAARSRIVDADYATESARLARDQILQQAGTAMLVQANQLPQQILALLRT